MNHVSKRETRRLVRGEKPKVKPVRTQKKCGCGWPLKKHCTQYRSPSVEHRADCDKFHHEWKPKP